MSNPFVWTDLSTFDAEKIRVFHEGLFRWRFSATTWGGDTSYFVASHWFTSVTAIFEMPERLQALDFPSFWIRYVRVHDVQRTVESAEAVEGVIIEVPPPDLEGGARRVDPRPLRCGVHRP